MDERKKGGGGVVKNRSSSGCLVVNKKLDGAVSGIGGSSSGVRGSKEEKKRPRLMISESSEDDELVGFDVKRDGGSGVSQGTSAPVVYKRGVGNHGEFSSRINDFDDVGFGRSDLMREVGIKRSKLDIYDFDEYDDFSDVDGLGMRHFYDRNTGGSKKRFSSSGQGIEFGSGGSGKGDIIYKRKNLFHGRATNEKIKDGRKQRFEVKPENPRSMGKEKVSGSRDEAIRLQGRNGVLKVMVKNKEIKGKLKPRNEGNNVVPRSHEITPKNVSIQHSSYSERRLQKRPLGICRVDEDRLKKRKALSTRSNEESDEESEDSDTSPKLQSESMEVHQSMKRGRNGGTIQSSEKAQPTKLKEGKVKRGSGTEKQLLREKIRKMLVDVGWTIDYRPRRGRDYSDAVYINPSGTAYWSIIKAYEALQKQLDEDGKRLKAAEDSSSFAPISDVVLSKLTRQTKKKMEKELKRKKREEGRGKIKKEFSVGNFEEDDDSDTDSTGSGRHDDRLSSFMKRSGKSFKGSSKEAYPNPNGKMERGERSSSISNSRFIHGRKSKKIGRCTLLIRNPQKEMGSESDRYVPYTGRRNLLSWLIDSGTVKLSEKVHYMNRRRTRTMLEGWITRDGIHCGCCSKILTVSKFEIHAASKLRQPFQNIYSSSGLSLLECQVEAWNRQDESLCSGFHKVDVDGDDPNDDTCAICGDGGNLICCDGCPSTFHQNCLDIQMLPVGDWHCAHCSCKFCGQADLSGTEANDQTKDTVLTCSLCERKYHSACVEEMDATPVSANRFPSFCGKRCQEVFERLQKLLGVKYELEGGLCWSLIRRTTLDYDTSVRAHPQRVEWNSKLAVALSVMDECFLPITDRRSGIHMIHNVLYNCGSNFTRLNYNGFYTAILEKGDEIICAASIRIHGTQFAEMPFIGTRHIYRRQGMCRRLFSAIESALCSLKVEKLIIPAISELMETWTTVFGFSGLGDKDKQEMKTLNMLSFPGTDMLQKKLLQSQSIAKKNSAGVKVGQHASMLPGLVDNPDPDVRPSSASAWPHDVNMKDKSAADVCLQDQCVSTAISNEIRPLVLTEGSQGTTSSAFLLDIKLSECAVADDNEELHGSLDTADEIQDIRKYLNDSPVKHDMEESEEHNVTQEAENGEADVASPSTADVPMTGTSDTVLLNSCLGNDSIADLEQHNSPVKHGMGESEEHNATQEAENGEADVALPSPADVPMPVTSDTALLDSCLGNESIAEVEQHNYHVKHDMEESKDYNVIQKAENGEADVASSSPGDVPMPGTSDNALLDSCLGSESIAEVEQHNYPVKHDMEESENYNVTQEAENSEADVASPSPGDVPMPGTSDTALLDSCLGNESIADVEQHNFPVKHGLEESEEHNVTQEAKNGEADVALPSPADDPMPGTSDTALLDSCLGNESIADMEQHNSPVKHGMEESEEHNVTQEAENGEADVALQSPADDPMLGTSDTAVLDSYLGNESIADVEQHNSPVKHGMQESEEHNVTQEAENSEADVALPSPADDPMPGTSDAALLDSCLGNESIAEVEQYNSPVKYDMEESEEHNLTQEAENGETDVALPSPADVHMAGTSDTAVLDSCLENESIAEVEQHNSHVKHDMEESEEHNVTQEAENGEADVALPPPADVPMPGTSDIAPLDRFLGNEPIADAEQYNLLEATNNNDITAEKPKIEFLAEGNNIAHEGRAKVADVSSSLHVLNVSGTEELDSTQEQKVEVSQSDLSHGAIEIEDPLPDSHDTNYSTLEGKVDPASVEASSFQPDSNVYCENPVLKKPELDPCESSTENPGDVDLIKHRLDSCGGNNVPISDGELHHPHDNGAGFANTLPISNSSFKASSPNVEAVIPVNILLPVTNSDHQSTT